MSRSWPPSTGCRHRNAAVELSALFKLSLSGQFWPVRLKPYNDELLSSWLLRLSRAYGTDPRCFCATISRHAAFRGDDVDQVTDDHLLKVLADQTATPWAQVSESTLPGYLGFAIRKRPRRGLRPWVLRTGRHDGRHPRLQYCPYCLQHDEDPYFRRPWRLTFVTTCAQHRCRLLDRCTKCLAPFTIPQGPSATDAITCCMRCQFDVRRARAPQVEAKVSHHRVIAFEVVLIEALRRGWCPLGRTLSVLTEEYLAVLLHLGRMLVSRRSSQDLRQAFCRQLGEPDFEPGFPSPQKRSIEVLSVADRFSLLVLLAWWLDDWPTRFIAMCSQVQLSPGDLSHSFRFPPDWYEDVVEQVARGSLTTTNIVLDGLARSAAFSLAALMDDA